MMRRYAIVVEKAKPNHAAYVPGQEMGSGANGTRLAVRRFRIMGCDYS